MNPGSFLVLDIIIILIALILLVWALVRDRQGERRSSSHATQSTRKPIRQKSLQKREIAQAILGGKIPSEEFQASIVSERIEEIVKQRLMSYEDLIGVDFDFGSAEDGSLEIWFAGRRYGTVDQIPDYRVRDAIAEAVQAFNLGSTDGGDIV
jgi:hypothetical protein